MALKKIMFKVTCDTWLIIFGTLVAVLLRCCTSLHPYSGEGTPPMYGDYEAQRHWMEVTVNLPINQWYLNGTNNNLEYWGLDYPPLTAYHMYICGLIAKSINTNYTNLHDSRGFESEEHKLFMRYTVLIADVILYVPALILYFGTTEKVYNNLGSNIINKKKNAEKFQILPRSFSTVMGLLYPGIILIDHGHFQYNCISLGLTIYAVLFILHRQNILSSICFCLALNYKQMELYHSLPFFLYLLSTCVPKPGQSAMGGIFRLVQIGITVIVTFAIVWSPFLSNFYDLLHVLQRQFPFARGVFEDKVANFWCILNIVFKLKSCDNFKMMRICLLTTLSAVFPSSVDLFLRPNMKKFVLGLINSSLAFFLFSFQVHEKTILVVSLPVLLYLPHDPFVCFWFLYMSIFSMVPLFIKDNLMIAVIALTLFYGISFQVCIEHFYQNFLNKSDGLREYYRSLVHTILNIEYKKANRFEDVIKVTYKQILKNKEALKSFIFHLVMLLSILGSLVLVVLSLILKPPQRYPDLFPLLISVYSCFHFMGFFIYFNIKQIEIPQQFDDIENVKVKGD